MPFHVGGTDVTLFSAIRTHKRHLGHLPNKKNTNFHVAEMNEERSEMMMKRWEYPVSQVIASVIGER